MSISSTTLIIAIITIIISFLLPKIPKFSEGYKRKYVREMRNGRRRYRDLLQNELQKGKR